MREFYNFRTSTSLNDDVVMRSRTAASSLEIAAAVWMPELTFAVTSTQDLVPGTHICGMNPNGEPFAQVAKAKPLVIGIMARRWGENLDIPGLPSGNVVSGRRLTFHIHY